MNPNLIRWLLRIDWRARAAVTLAGLTACLIALFAGIGIWHRPPLLVVAACLLGGSLTVLMFRGSRVWLNRIDWRLAAIFWASAVSIAATLLGFDLGWDTATGFLHDVFAGWVASLAFFGFIGLLVAGVSLTQPEEGSFESRARILFRGQDGKHIEYIVGRIRETLEHYAEEVSNTFTVVDYRPAERMFLVRAEATTVLRSYLSDVRTTYNSEISMEAEAPPPPGASPNRLLHLRVGTRTWGSKPFQDNGIHQPIDTIIEPGGSCEVAYGIECWTRAETEPNTYSPVRYTQHASLTIQNQLSENDTVRISLTRIGGNGTEIHSIAPGDRKKVCDVRDIRPGEIVYDFRILPLN